LFFAHCIALLDIFWSSTLRRRLNLLLGILLGQSAQHMVGAWLKIRAIALGAHHEVDGAGRPGVLPKFGGTSDLEALAGQGDGGHG
jgi:hypothetical protein